MSGYRPVKIKNIILFLLIFCSNLFYGCSSSDENRKKNGLFNNGLNFSILSMGDLLIARDVEDIMRCVGPRYPFEKIEKELKQHDIVLANLETSVTERGNKHSWKAYTFRISPENAQYLKELKIDILNLANNHMLDFGRLGMSDTLNFIEKWGVLKFGAGWDLEDARKPAMKNIGKTKVFFLGYCERPPFDFFAGENKAGTAPLKIESVLKDIKKYKKDDSLVFISLHWGVEYASYPREDQVEIAHQIIDGGADGIIGHHPHVPQGIEIYKGKPIIYSLGNAINGYYEPTAQNNIMVAIHCKGTAVNQLEIFPLAGKNHEMHFQPFFLEDESAIITLKHIRQISEKFQTPIEIRNNRGYVDVASLRPVIKEKKSKKNDKEKNEDKDKDVKESNDDEESKNLSDKAIEDEKSNKKKSKKNKKKNKPKKNKKKSSNSK